MTFDRLNSDRTFVAVVETGSFTSAAERLSMSSGQASKLVSKLEARLGVRLLSRTTRAISLTEVGQAYLDRIRPILDELEQLDSSVSDAFGNLRGRVRVTAPLTFGTLEIAPALNEFAKLFPAIELDVDFSDRVTNVVEEGYDLAIRVGPLEESSLIARKLCDVRILVVASPAYLEKAGEPVEPADLASHECIVDTNFREPNRWPFAGTDDGPKGFRVAGRVRYSNTEACLTAAVAGLRLACVPSFVASGALRERRVRNVLRQFQPEAYPVHVLYPHSRHLTGKVRALVDFLVQRYRTRTLEDIASE